MTKDELLFRIAEQLMSEADALDPKWEDLVLTIQYDDESTSVSGVLYAPGGATSPFAPRTLDFDLVDDFRDTMAAEADAPKWVAGKIAINHASTELEAEFDYDDVARWETDADLRVQTEPAPKKARAKPAAKKKKAAPAKKAKAAKKAAPKKVKAKPAARKAAATKKAQRAKKR